MSFSERNLRFASLLTPSLFLTTAPAFIPYSCILLHLLFVPLWAHGPNTITSCSPSRWALPLCWSLRFSPLPPSSVPFLRSPHSSFLVLIFLPGGDLAKQNLSFFLFTLLLLLSARLALIPSPFNYDPAGGRSFFPEAKSGHQVFLRGV